MNQESDSNRLFLDIRFFIERFVFWVSLFVCFNIQHFKCVTPLPLTIIVSNLKSAANLIEVPLCMMSHISLSVLRLALFLAFSIFIMMCLGVNIFVFMLLRIYCVSCMCGLIFFIRFGVLFCHYSLEYLFCPFL